MAVTATPHRWPPMLGTPLSPAAMPFM